MGKKQPQRKLREYYKQITAEERQAVHVQLLFVSTHHKNKMYKSFNPTLRHIRPVKGRAIVTKKLSVT